MADSGPMVLRVCRAVVGPDEAEDAWSETVPGRAEGIPAAGRGRQRGEAAGHDRAPRRPSTPPARRRGGRSRPGRWPERLASTGRPEDWDGDLWRGAGRCRLPSSASRGLPLPGRAAVRADRRHHRRQHRRAAPLRAAADGSDAARHLPGAHEGRRGPMMATREPEATASTERRRAPDGPVRVASGAGRAGDARRLHARLAAAARRRAASSTSPTARWTRRSATLLLAATEQGLVRVAYPNQGHDAALAQLAELVSPRILNAPGLAGRGGPPARLSTSRAPPPGVRRAGGPRGCRAASATACCTHLLQIPYGATRATPQVAAATGHPRAVRADRHRVRHQPGADRGALPPGGALRRLARRLPHAARTPSGRC